MPSNYFLGLFLSSDHPQQTNTLHIIFNSLCLSSGGVLERKICIIDGVRTRFVRAGSEFNDVPAFELGRSVITELIDRCDRPGFSVDEVIFGNIIGPAEASNIARVMALEAGLPNTTPAYSLNMNCASGLLALGQAYDHILSGRANVVIAGGTESMSHAPLQFPKAMGGFLAGMMRAKTPLKKLAQLIKLRPSFFKPTITLVQGLTDPVSGLIMGKTAEILVKRYDISREEQDEFALASHQKYFASLEDGFYNDHVIPHFIGPKYKAHVETDIGPRDGLTLEKLAKLRPYFDRKHGSVTVGNSCPITDGAAGCVLMEVEHARRLGFTPKYIVRGYGYRGVAPEIMGLGPSVSTPVALENAGVTMNDIQLIEINEAFAGQVIANQRVFASEKHYRKLTGESSSPLQEFDPAILNVNGGAIALGHPVGTSGTRIVINLFKEMERRKLNIGLASICVGGGLGGSLIVERC
jgi:acetyl-CoA acetyltransferase family protein